jgi:hypothetical protein
MTASLLLDNDGMQVHVTEDHKVTISDGTNTITLTQSQVRAALIKLHAHVNLEAPEPQEDSNKAAHHLVNSGGRGTK